MPSKVGYLLHSPHRAYLSGHHLLPHILCLLSPSFARITQAAYGSLGADVPSGDNTWPKCDKRQCTVTAAKNNHSQAKGLVEAQWCMVPML